MRKVFTQEEDEVLYDMKEDKLKLIKNEILRNVLEEVICIEVSCKDKRGAEVVYDAVM